MFIMSVLLSTSSVANGEQGVYRHAIDDPMGLQKSKVLEMHDVYSFYGTDIYPPSITRMLNLGAAKMTGYDDPQKAWGAIISKDDIVALKFNDCGVLNGVTICAGEDNWEDSLGNGKWDVGEEFIDMNDNNEYDDESFNGEGEILTLSGNSLENSGTTTITFSSVQINEDANAFGNSCEINLGLDYLSVTGKINYYKDASPVPGVEITMTQLDNLSLIEGFTSNEDGTFDLESYQETVNNGTMPVELEPLLLRWEIYLRGYLSNRKLRTLYDQLGSINDEDVKRKYMKDSLNCTIDYIYLPLSDISDSLVEVSEEEILNQYEENKEDSYSTKERQIVEYVLFNLPKPVTSEDSLDFVAVEDSVMQLARDFVAEADYVSFSKALEQFEITDVDTIDIHETFEANSGIPFQMGVLRPAVRFAFDNGLGSISDPITAQNGIAIFHTLGKKSSGYKPLDDVKESIRRSLVRENKSIHAKNMLKSVL